MAGPEPEPSLCAHLEEFLAEDSAPALARALCSRQCCKECERPTARPRARSFGDTAVPGGDRPSRLGSGLVQAWLDDDAELVLCLGCSSLLCPLHAAGQVGCGPRLPMAAFRAGGEAAEAALECRCGGRGPAPVGRGLALALAAGELREPYRSPLLLAMLLGQARDAARLLDTVLTVHGPRLCLQAGDVALTYRAVQLRCWALARRLRSLGLAAGAPVLVLAELCPEALVADWACLLAGYVPALLPAATPAAALAALLAESPPAALLARARPALPLPCPFVLLTGEAAAHYCAPGPLGDPARPALLTATSGSTGVPRLVASSHRALLAQLRAAVPRPGDVAAAWHFADLRAALVFLPGGGPTTLCPHLATLFADLAAAAPTFLLATPFLLTELRAAWAGEPEPDYGRRMLGPRLAELTVGGAPVPPAALAFFRRCFPACHVAELYGTTEAGAIGRDGQFRPGVEWRLEGTGPWQPSDQPYPRGHLLVRTPASAERGWVPTGDLVQLTGPRHFRLLGRTASQAKLATGEFLAPEALEQVYASASARALLIAPLSRGCVALVVPAPGADAPTLLAELRTLGRGRRPAERPRAVLFCEPWTAANGQLTGTGKPRRAAILAANAARLAAVEAETSWAPAGDEGEEEGLVAVVARLLGRRAGDVAGLSLAEAGCDSVAAVRLGAALAAAGHAIPPALLLAPLPLAALAEAVAGLGPGPLPRPPDYLDWDAELAAARAQLDLQPLPGPLARRAGLVLLTGGSGFLGGILAPLLGPDLCELRRRPAPGHVAGDLTQPQLGLSPAAYAALAARVAVVVHCAAAVSAVQPFAALRPANVDGTLRLLRLAADAARAQAAPVRFLFVSSAAVLNAHPPGSLAESTDLALPAAAVASLDGYSKSKWLADRLCLALRPALAAAGVELTVARPGFIGAAADGRANPADFDSRLLLSCARRGLHPAAEAPLDRTPADWLAACLADLAWRPAPAPVYHFQNPSAPPLSAFWPALAAACPLAPVSYAEWRAGIGPADPLFPLLELLPPAGLPGRAGARLDCRESVAAWGRPPPITAEHIARQVRWLLAWDSQHP